MHTKLELLELCDCAGCPLDDIRMPVLGSGPEKAAIVFVGEAPGKDEIRTGNVFTGPAGRLLNATLSEHGLSREDVYVTNVALCRPTAEWKDVEPPPEALKACYERLVAEIQDREPKFVVTLGAVSSRVLVGASKDTKISELTGATFWNKDIGVWVIPTFHPAAVLHGGIGYFDDIYETIQRLSRMLDGTIPEPSFDDETFEYALYDDEDISEVRKAIYEIRNGILGETTLAIDTETQYADLPGPNNQLLMVQIGSTERAFCFTAQSLLNDPITKGMFQALLVSKDITWAMHNAKFDDNQLRYWFGVVPRKFIDTMAMALGVTEREGQIGLKKLARRFLNAGYYEGEIRQYLPNDSVPFSRVPVEVLAKYGAADVIYTARLVPVLETFIRDEGTYNHVMNWLVPAQRAFAEMEGWSGGTSVDLEYAKELHAEWDPKVAEAAGELQKYASDAGFDARNCVQDSKDGVLNPKSSKQLQHLFWDVLQLTPPIPSKGRSCDAEVLAAMEGQRVAQLLLHFRQMTHMLTTYVDGILDDVREDGRVHPDFRIAGTVTGRLSIRNPPLQTIPRADTVEAGEFDSIKRLFNAPAGHVFCNADYKALELHVAWHYSNDDALGEILTSGRDFHRSVSAKIWNKPYDSITKAERELSKLTTYGLMYGRNAWSLATGEMQCSVAEAQEHIDGFFEGFPKFAEWWRGQQESVVRDGYLQTSIGRKRRWTLFTANNREEIQRQAVNFPIQSLASDLCLSALIRLNRLLREQQLGKVLFTVHDSLTFELLEARLDEALHLVDTVMCTPTFETCAVFYVDLEVGPNWGDVQKVILQDRRNFGV